MKLTVFVVLVAFLLSGCSRTQQEMSQAMELRRSILEAQGCSFDATITADYEDIFYTFQMSCRADNTGTLYFTVKDPDTIAGISGSISQDRSVLTFDDKILAFPILADGELTPVSAPWIFLNTLKGGYLRGYSQTDDSLCLYIDDSFEEDPLHLEIETDSETTPISAQILWQDRRILSLQIENFIIL